MFTINHHERIDALNVELKRVNQQSRAYSRHGNKHGMEMSAKRAAVLRLQISIEEARYRFRELNDALESAYNTLEKSIRQMNDDERNSNAN